MKKDCTIYFLEMPQKIEYPPKDQALHLVELSKPITPSRFLYCYNRVGQDYNWSDRLAYNTADLQAILDQEQCHIYLLKKNEQEVGFTELQVENDHVEILFFGLYPEAIGQGWGKQFLELVITQAWSFKPPKVQLNTCDWDHPRALRNYLRAGFKEVKRMVKNQ